MESMEKAIWITRSGKKKKQEITCNLKLSPVFRHVPDCANRLYNVGKLKVPHKCLYKVIKKKKNPTCRHGTQVG